MSFYDREILDGLSRIPTPSHPGSLVIFGDAQSVFTGPKPGDTFIGATRYGLGKVIAAAHDCYFHWLLNPDETELRAAFVKNLKKWLTGDEDVPTESIAYLKDVDMDKMGEYKILLWDAGFEPGDEYVEALLTHVRQGGALVCAATPWGYLQVHPGRTLGDMPLFEFLKEHMGMIFTDVTQWLSAEMDVAQSRAKHSHFDLALEKIKNNPKKIDKYMNTVSDGLGPLKREGKLEMELVCELKNIVLEDCECSNVNPIPCDVKPVCKEDEKHISKFISKCLNVTSDDKAPGVAHFPGDFEYEPELRQDVLIDVECDFEERISTGYYLPAGVSVKVKVVKGNPEKWRLRVGAHTDDISDCDKYTRWPSVSLEIPLEHETELFSPYGGLVYFDSPRAGQLKVSLSNVVEAPLFDLTRPETVRDWNRRREAPGLWAELAGKHIIFTTPSECIRHLEDPQEVLEFWDDVVRTHHECRGTNVNDQRRERIVNDMQPSAGYMHSGYPIVTHLDCCKQDNKHCIFDVAKLRQHGNWGLFHEIGHNMQRGDWTFDGAGEVTVNIFSMHAETFVRGIEKVTEQSWPVDRFSEFRSYFAKQPTYADWQASNGMALMTFVQLIKHFGWDAMHKFLSDYERDIKNGHNLPGSNQDKIDQWVLRYSKIVNKNIKPQFEMFGLPVSNSVADELAHLEPWCPVHEKDPRKFFDF